MAEIWYYTRDGKAMEPVTHADLQKLALAGLLKPTDLVWKEGMANWAWASAASGLFSEEDAGDVLTATEVAAPGAAQRPPYDQQPDLYDDTRRRDWGHPDHGDEDDEQLRRRRRPSRQRPRMSVGLKVGLILGGSLVAIIVVAVGLAAVRSNERVRAQIQAANRRPAFRFNQAPGMVNPPRFNQPMQGPIVQPPSFLGPITLGPKETVLNNQINFADSRVHVEYPLGNHLNLSCKVFTVTMTAGKTYTIRQESQAFDSYLVLQDTNFLLLADDDDSGGGPTGLDSLITFRCPSTGTYRVIAAALHEGTGFFTLKIKED